MKGTEKKISFDIDIKDSDLDEDEILIQICSCSNLNDLAKFLNEHHITIKENTRYDENDYFMICESLRSKQATEFAKIQYAHWLANVGNKIFSIKK